MTRPATDLDARRRSPAALALVARAERIRDTAAAAIAAHARLAAGDLAAAVDLDRLSAQLRALHGLGPDATSADLRDATDREHREVLAALGLPDDYVDPALGLPPAWPDLEQEP